MIRTATRDDLPALRRLFAESNDAPYDLAAVAEEKCFGDGIAGSPVTRIIEDDGKVIAAAVQCGKWLRILIVDRDHRRRGLGSQLIGDATVIAAEPGNYFTPGVAMRDEGSRAFFLARGFAEGAVTWNLHVTLSRADDEESRNAASSHFEILRCAQDDEERVLNFVEREFGRIWRFEAAKAFERDIPPAFVTEENGEITGFVVHDVNNRGLGWFGPTGVAKLMRGRGAGGKLLLASLADLQRLGYENVVIPWTDALDFYRKVCGAIPAEQFVAFARTRT
jgi:GNAT superfamily N-acetyltransferase/N-acetylglutamate synthase-like GNAT family acetyltransferase